MPILLSSIWYLHWWNEQLLQWNPCGQKQVTLQHLVLLSFHIAPASSRTGKKLGNSPRPQLQSPERKGIQVTTCQWDRTAPGALKILHWVTWGTETEKQYFQYFPLKWGVHRLSGGKMAVFLFAGNKNEVAATNLIASNKPEQLKQLIWYINN